MPTPPDTSTISEHDSHSDSDWLDIASTDRDSDDNDSIYSSRETDHEDRSRSRSRRSSLSYGSSRDGDVDAWEGLIDDSADERMPNDVLAPNHHVPSPSQPPANSDLDHVQEPSPEELLINEGLDQSMVSTLSTSRSSSLHASTVHNSSRDLRLSFPDPIHSSRREPLSICNDEVPPNSDSEIIPSSIEPEVPAAHQTDDEEMLSASQSLPAEMQAVSAPSGPELKVFLFGFPTIFKWSIANKVLQKVARGAGLTINADLDGLQGSMRRLTVSGSFEHDRGFPRTITVFDRTLHPYDIADDLTLMDLSSIRPAAIVLLPCRPLPLPEHVLQLPVLASSYSGEFASFDMDDAPLPQGSWGMLNVPDHQLLRITAPEESPIVDKDLIHLLDSSRTYRAFSRLWSSDNNTSKGIMTSTHALTIIAILSLLLGVIVRAAVPVSLQHFTSPSNLSNHSSASFWRMLRPAPYRERLPPSTSLDGSAVAISSSSKDSSLSVFCAESTSITLSYANPTNFRRVIPSTLSERSKFSQDLILQPPRSVLPPDNRPKALSVIPDTSPTHLSDPVTTGDAVSALVHTSVSGVVKGYATVALSVVSQDLDMQDIFDALDALVQAISRQTQIVLAQAMTLMEQSARQWEKSVESLEQIKETLHVRNEHARKRAKEIKEMGTRWFNDASEAVVASAELSKGMAWDVAESVANRAQRARGRAKDVAEEIQEFLSKHERLDTLGANAWYTQTKHWEEWMRRARKQGQMGKARKQSKRKPKSAIFRDGYF